MTLLMLVGGLALLVAGGEALVRGAVAAAARFGVSPLLIGLTLVGFGTSTPELVTSLEAAFLDAPGIAIGNVVGSNIANILLILGVAALISPILVQRASLIRDGGVAALAALACAGVIAVGALERWAGAALLLGLVAYLVAAYRRERSQAASGHAAAEAAGAAPVIPLWRAAAFFVGGLAATIFGAKLLVSAAIDAALGFGVSEAVIGLTIVAVGTSLPELVTGVMAARRGHADIAFGNVVGSNIFNVFGILGVTALVHPIPAPQSIADFDVWVMLGATAALFVVAATSRRITRGEGGALLAAYVVYIAALLLFAAPAP